MLEIPETLRSVFTSTVEEQDDRYVIEVPKHELDNDALRAGARYRIAVVDTPAPPARAPDAHSTTESAAPSSNDSGGRGPPEPPVEEGEVRTVTIETLGDQGDGIAKVERGYVIIVPDVNPGEQPTVKVEEVQQNVAFARVLDQPGGNR